MMATEPTKTTRKNGARKASKRASAAKTSGRKAADAAKATGTTTAGAAKTRATPRRPATKSATDQVRDTVNERIVKPARAAAETAAEAARGAAQSARDTLSSAASQSSTFSLKMIEHAEANTREAFNAMRAAAKSKDVSEVMRVQGDYLREQGARSLSQAREVSELIAQFGRDAIAPLTGRRK